MEKRKVTCRPCKEQHNWEIESPEGQVLKEHYPNREECLKAGLKYAEECGCDLCVCAACDSDEGSYKNYR